jgi:predicted exporter
MKRTPQALMLLALWIAALAVLGWFVQRQLVIGTDLRLFLPKPTTPQQRLLLDEIGEGPASRMLVIALGGAAPAQLADASRALAEELRDSQQFSFVANGELSFESLPEELLPYRYLLSPTLDAHQYDTDYLRSQLEERARDLASPAGSFLEPWLPRDPSLELLQVLQRWQPMEEPRRDFDVWFDREGKQALLIAQTQAPAFDPDRQRLALQTLQQALHSTGDDASLAMTVSGAGKFSVMMEERTRGEAQALGTAATVGMIVLLLIAYRGIGSVVLSALPLASAGLAGLAAVSAVFGEVHGITLAFGFTLIGVAQDYPIHLLSHRRVDRSAATVAHDLWPTLATGVASTCIAYLTFVFSGVTGLAQLACFTVVGLAIAGLSTRFALPALLAATGVDPGASAFLDRLWQRIADLPRMRWVAVALAAICVAVVLITPHPFWENDLGKLTPVPLKLIEEDQHLRAQLGAPDVRYLLVLAAPDGAQALERLEALEPGLRRLVESGAITGYDDAARYVPPSAVQRRRQQRLPDQQTLRAALQSAVANTAFRPDVFEPFIADVERARQLPPLTIERMTSTPLGAGLQMLLAEREDKATALVTLSGVRDAAALQSFATAAGSDVTLLDMKEASETLVANQRGRLLWSLAVAAVLLIGVIAFSLRDRQRVYRVLAPMVLTTLLIIATLQATGTSLTLFHLIALMLAAGLGLDYALFFEHASQDRAEQNRTLHAVIVCSLSTLMVFALLATSSLPVLRAIGVTVSLGVIFNFILALLLTRPEATHHAVE